MIYEPFESSALCLFLLSPPITKVEVIPSWYEIRSCNTEYDCVANSLVGDMIIHRVPEI